MDAWTGEFNDQFGPSGLRAYHVSPGFVATNDAERFRSYIAFSAFNAFWMFTLIASRISNDVLVYNFYICITFTAMLCIWIGAWIHGSLTRASR